MSDYDGKKFALILVGTDAKGEDEWTAFFGTGVYVYGALCLDRGSNGPPFEIHEEWLPLIQPVHEDVKATLHDAEFVLMLTVRKLPDDDDGEDYVATGLKMPKD